MPVRHEEDVGQVALICDRMPGIDPPEIRGFEEHRPDIIAGVRERRRKERLEVIRGRLMSGVVLHVALCGPLVTFSRTFARAS